MEKHLVSSRFFLAGLLISPLLISPFVLDFTLTARFISLSFFILVTLLFLLLYRGNLKINFDGILISYLAYVLFCTLSISWAHTPSEAIFDSSKLLLSFFVFVLTYFVLKNNKALFDAAFTRLPVIIFLAGLTAAMWQLSSAPDLKKDSMYLVTGINGHKNLYASFLFLNFFFLVKAFFKTKNTWKIINAACILLSLAVIALLRTKAVWIGLSTAILIVTVLYFLMKKKMPRINFVFILVFLLIMINVFFLFVLKPVISKGIQSNAQILALKPELRQQKELDNERLVLWDKTYDVFKKHSVTGVGMGNWQIYFPDETLTGLWRAEDLNYTFQRPHNDFLWILAETGLIGFNLFFLFLFSLLLFILKAAKNTGKKIIQTELLLCFSFITGYFIISFFDFPKERIEHLIWINIILATAYFYIRQIIPLKSFYCLQVNQRLRVIPLALLLFITCVGILRYKGEFFTRRMYDQKKVNNYTAVIKEGKKACSFAYSLDPTSLPIYWFTGNAYAALSDYQTAHYDFLKAYKLNPYNRNVLNDLGSSYAFLNETAQARKFYEEAARISPRFDDPKLNLAAQYIREQDYKNADIVLESIFHDSERRSTYQKMVDAFLQKKP